MTNYPTRMDDDEALTRRAFAAYFRGGENRDFPGNHSGVQEANGHVYVVLRNANGILAVYRVRNDGMLKGLKRWPRELADY